jgi:hypothetical protein
MPYRSIMRADSGPTMVKLTKFNFYQGRGVRSNTAQPMITAVGLGVLLCVAELIKCHTTCIVYLAEYQQESKNSRVVYR